MKVKLCDLFFDRSDGCVVVVVAVALSLVEVAVGCVCGSCLYRLDCLLDVYRVFDLPIYFVFEVDGVNGGEGLPCFE